MKLVLYAALLVLFAAGVAAYHDDYPYRSYYGGSSYTERVEVGSTFGPHYTYTYSYRAPGGRCIGSGCGYSYGRYSGGCSGCAYRQGVRYNEVYNRIRGNYPKPRCY